MILLSLFAVSLVALATLAYFFRTAKELPKSWYEFRTELRFQYIGLLGIAHDWFYASRDKVVFYNQSNKIAVITGGNRGIGLRVVEKLLSSEITVIMACRDPKAGEEAVRKIIDPSEAKGTLICEALDIGEIKSVVEFAKRIKEKYKKIDILINNAGIMFAPYHKTSDGYESHFAVNYLGHFLLTHLLMPLIKAAGKPDQTARIVNVSSIVNLIGRINYKDINGEKYFYPACAYSQSKLAQILSTRHLNKILKDEGAHVEVFSVHPGVVDTDLFEYSSTTSIPFLKKLLFKTPEQGSRCIYFAATGHSLEGKGGIHLSNCGKSPVHKSAKNPKKCEELFNFTCDLLNIKHFGNGEL